MSPVVLQPAIRYFASSISFSLYPCCVLAFIPFSSIIFSWLFLAFTRLVIQPLSSRQLTAEELLHHATWILGSHNDKISRKRINTCFAQNYLVSEHTIITINANADKSHYNRIYAYSRHVLPRIQDILSFEFLVDIQNMP